MSRRIEWIEDRARLDDPDLVAGWQRLAELDGTPFATTTWFRCWWDAFGPPRTLAVATVHDGESLAAVFPLARRGRRLEALANVHTPLFRPLAADGPALEAVVSAALDASSELELFGVPDGDPALGALERSASSSGRLGLLEPQHTSPIVETNGDLEGYLKTHRDALREVRRRRRKMEREHRTCFRLAERPESLEQELERGLELERSGWKGHGETAILSSPETAAFYRSVAAAFDAEDQLRLSTLEIDGELAGFDLALLSADRYWLLKTAYDEQRARLGPGMALRLAAVERCFELGLEAHEFLGDDMEYKRRFSNAERRHVGFRAYALRPGPLARYGYRRHLRPALRRAYRRAQRARSEGQGSR